MAGITKSLVIARYNEDVSWAAKLSGLQNIYLYNKGKDLEPDPHFIHTRLENVGREGHTYLHYIISQYNNLSDYTIFCQGNPFDHCSLAFLNNCISELVMPRMPGKKVYVPRVCCLKEWDSYGQLVHPAQWGEWYKEGVIARSRFTMRNWFRWYLDVDLPDTGIWYSPGACMCVPRESILRNDKQFYFNLIDTVNYHVHPEEGYYLERAWLYIFKGIPNDA